MSISTLSWFVEMMSTHPAAPNEAKDLTQELKSEVDIALNPIFNNKSKRQKISRIFERHSQSLPVIASWLDQDIINKQVNDTKNPQILSAFLDSKKAIAQIIAKKSAGAAWNMGSRRGANPGFSKTLEAAALYSYLTNEKEFNFSKNSAIEIASTLLDVNPDEIRRYDVLKALNNDSEAAIAFSAIARHGRIEMADHYFDVETLKERAIK